MSKKMREDLAEIGRTATQIMIFLPHHTWAENNNDQVLFCYYSLYRIVTKIIEHV